MPYFGIPIRNGLPIGLGSVAGFGVQQFSPADLFSAGEQGAWYDPSDLTTLFTDSAGTTPVTAVEQAVGLMLDKSKGLALGSELITGAFVNGVAFPWPSFSASGTGFTASVTGVFNIYQVANPNGISIVNGRWYKVSVNITQSTDDAVSVSFQNSSTGGGITQSTTYTFGPTTASTITFYLQATSTSTAYLQFSQQGTTITFNVASVTVKELPGNHAYQSTSTSRPVLRARYNLLTYSEQFNNAAWTRTNFLAFGSGSIVNAIAAPDGTVTADLLTESTAASANFFFNQTTSLSASTQYTYSIYCKPNGRSRLYLAGTSTAWGAGFITFDLNTLVVSPSGGSGWTGTISPLSDGWYRITATRTTNTGISGGYDLSLFFLNNAGNVTYTGDGVSGMYFWGAQLIVTNSLPSNAYQRIAAATDYNSSGFLPYLAFDGTDDSLLTNSVDFTATDKMTVWAGVRKLAESGGGQAIVELSSASVSNNGAFGILDNGSPDFVLSFLSRGTSFVYAQPAAGSSPAPVTKVLCTIGNISAPQAAIRYDTVQVQSLSTSQGTGNYGNYPLYIGRRGGSTIPFNGNLYSLIIRGAQSSAAQISSTESWVNGKTAAY
jgi:hypothetical protein